MGTAQAQAELWNGAPRDWAQYQEMEFAPIYQTILALADVGQRSEVLDVGCGSGYFCHLAAMRGARVSGLDATDGLIAIACERTPAGDFRIGDMEELPFPDKKFDLVTGFNSFQFAADPAAALREARRVAKPNGMVAMAVWGRAEDCEAAKFLMALASVLPPPPSGTPGPFALSAPGILEGMLSKASLKAEKSGEVSTPFKFASDDIAYRAIVASGPGVRAVRHAGDAKVRATVMPAIAPYKQANGSYLFKNKFRYVVARP